MFIVQAHDDRTEDRYDTLDEVYRNCEGIDVRDGLYSFSDDLGNVYDVEWVEKVVERKHLFGLLTSLTQGKYRLGQEDLDHANTTNFRRIQK